MNASERMEAAINLQPVDRVPNAPFYEAPICTYFGCSFRAALLGGGPMQTAHMKGLDTFRFDWVMVGMGLIGGIIPEALGCRVAYPENVFPIIEKTVIKAIDDVETLAMAKVQTERMDRFLEGVALLKSELKGQVPIACEYISPFTIATRLRGTNEIMDDMYGAPDLVHAMQAALVPYDIEVGRLLIDAGVEYIFYGADMECPLLISPAHYREFVHGPTRIVVNALADMGARVLPHMCGNIVDTGIADMLLEMNIGGIMPGNLTQDEVLDLRLLKQKVGNRTAVFDNLNPNGSLLIGSPGETARDTRRHLECAADFTGYLFSTAGTTSPKTPIENFTAMNREVLDFE